jgi:hypothetical protein
LDATVTNAYSNALHATFLLVYFLGARRHLRRDSGSFTSLVVGLFLLLFVVKVLGVIVHALPPSRPVDIAWGIVAILTILLNDCVLRTTNALASLRLAVVALSVYCALAFALGGGEFAFLALPGFFVFAVTGFRSPGLRRVGFLMASGSNLVWIAARKITETVRGGELPASLRYDNDIYHFLLIASTFVIYKGFAADQKEDEAAGRPSATPR